jgi:lysophospholipase L1-like esterase
MDLKFKSPCKILVCGDSISAGVVFSEKENRYIKSKESFVCMLQNSLDGVITNVSRFGNTLTTALPKLKRDMEKQKPDIVLIELGGNDCDYKWEQVAENPLGEHLPATNIEDFKAGLISLISSLRKNDVAPVLTTLPPIDAERYFKWISSQNAEKAANILQWLGSVSRIYWWQERYNAAVLRVAESTNTAWIDLRSAFLGAPDFRKFLCMDGIHPNSEGHKLIFKAILEYINLNYPALMKPTPILA